MDSKAFLGSGINFPFKIDKSSGQIAMADHEEDIRQSIALILNTYCGERVMRPTFGARVQDYLFEEGTRSVGFSLQQNIEDALIRWEPRIDDIEVEVENETRSRAQITVNIKYRVRSTNNMFNIVYPFYMLEGIGLEDANR